MIHCIGDSHSSVFSGEEKMQDVWPERSNDTTQYFRSYRIGPATAYNLSTKIYIIDDIINHVGISKEKDIILLCFGEVDVRAHLIKQANIQNKSFDEVCEECVDNYIKGIKILKNKGFNIAVWGVIASFNESVKNYIGPSFGTNLERNQVTKIFNNLLNERLKNFNIPFVSIFEEMLNPDGTTNPIYLDDWEDCHIHLSQRAMPLIMSAFKEQGIL
jgi:hypothetical protein